MGAHLKIFWFAKTLRRDRDSWKVDRRSIPILSAETLKCDMFFSLHAYLIKNKISNQDNK